MNTAKINPAFLSYADKRCYWTNIITTWYLSGLRMKPFCNKHQLSLKQLRRWFYKLNLSRPVSLAPEPKNQAVYGDTANRSKETCFIPITIEALKEQVARACPSGIELIFEQGYRLILQAGFDETLFCNVLSVVGAARC